MVWLRNKGSQQIREAKAALDLTRKQLMADVAKLAVLQAAIQHGKIKEANLAAAIVEMEEIEARGLPPVPPAPKRDGNYLD